MILTKYDLKNYFSDCSIIALQTIYKSYIPASNENNFQNLPIIVSKATNINLPKRQPFQLIKLN